MYMAYGWPQSIPLDPGDSDRVVLLRVLGRYLLAVCPASLHLWSAAHHKVRLARLDRSPESLAAHGDNAHSVWSPDAKTVAVLTSSFYLYIYKLQFSGKPLIIGGKPQPGLCLASISQIIVEKVPLANDAFITSNFVCDSKSMLLGLSNGHLQVISWNAEFSDSFKLGCSACSSNRTPTVGDALVFDPPSLRENSDASPAPCCTGNSAIIHVELSVKLRLLVALYSGCQIGLCAVGKKGLKQTSSIRVERWLNTDDAMCTSVASDQQILAVGCSRGVVDLYDLAENARHIRTISLYDWGYELLFFPRYHLDYSSLLYRKSLLGRPIVMDVFQDYILVTYSPFDVHIFHVVISGELSPASSPVLQQLSTVRELSIMSPKSPPVSMRFIPEPTDEGKPKHDTNGSSDLSQQPSRCLILRMNGELSVLDMDDGHEQSLTNSVELFWVTCSQYEEKGNLIKEVSWLDYGHKGMQVWYPSHGENPFKQEDFLQLDPELEFDREVYPLGLLPNVGVVVGISQRMSFSTAEFPCFEPSPQAQTILHCLLRHLLQRDKHEEALRLANLSAEKPHFSRCLEWLLFTVFDAEISSQSASKNQLSQKNEPAKKSLLDKTCDLLRNFPEYMDVVVSVARKTDGRHWADLFHAAGRSTEMFEECFQRRWYRTAACYILVIAKLEGPAVSQYCALRLLQATLDESLYELAGELVRFLLRSGRDFENASTDSEKLSPRFLSYFQLRSPFKRQSSDLRSNSMKELSPHIASVMNILENHASYLMSGKELSKLVAFVKGTQFDLVEYLQRERLGSARLENFASALELIGQKLQMDTLQSRLDAEFLLAHMCSVKFKEWIVVLATLLRRAEVLVDLFRHDLRLWKAYNITLQSHDVFREYLDLLNTLEEELSSVSDLTLQNRPVS
uniref:RIC1 C-terminal alpha solenoid region domain-containing protein n=1 Tax=Oryza rufipogon TaxID=4529 RepID=A0A0E0NLV9_ORYRU